MHIHVSCPDGEAKFWLEPVVALENYSGLNSQQIKIIQDIVEERKDDIKKAWQKHFQS